MIRHLFTLIWNRKRANFLLIAEIVLSFFVLFVVSSLLVYNYRNYSQPSGFRYANVWEMNLNPGQDTTERRGALRQLFQRLRAVPGVVEVSRSSSNTPFAFSNMNTSLWYNHQPTPQTEFYYVDDELPRVLGMNVVQGRWFDRRDDGAARQAAVVNQAFVDAVFKGESPLGKIIQDDEKNPKATQWRIVGVVDAYRSGNDFSSNDPAIFERNVLQDTARISLQSNFNVLIRVQPGSGAQLEQQLVKVARNETKGWGASINTLTENRATKMKVVLTPLIALGIVCLFLIVNVTLGLFGVLWYNINQRRAEIGLRRALGATGSGISVQFLGEMLVVTTFGVAVGALLAVQFPLLGVFGVPGVVYGAAIALATVLIFVITAVCAFHPSRLAAGIQPAIALREE